MEESNGETICVWEGEWPLLKSIVREGRRSTIHTVSVVIDVLDLQSYVHLAKTAAASVDTSVVTASKKAALFLDKNPWLLPAAGISCFGMLVFAKSTRWGPVAALRNGVAASAAMTALVFPQQLRTLVIDNYPF